MNTQTSQVQLQRFLEFSNGSNRCRTAQPRTACRRAQARVYGHRLIPPFDSHCMSESSLLPSPIFLPNHRAMDQWKGALESASANPTNISQVIPATSPLWSHILARTSSTNSRTISLFGGLGPYRAPTTPFRPDKARRNISGKIPSRGSYLI